MSETKKYYWLKLQRDFFKRHDTQIIESMPNGEKYLIFYLKLLCESVDHDGRLRFSEDIPYEEEMLATITHMNIDIVKAAIKLFTNLKMMEVMDDGTYFMNQIEKMTGSVSSDAIRMKISRENKANSLPDKDETNNVQNCSKNVHQSIELRDKSKEIELDIRDNKKPSKHKYGEYKNVLLTDDEYKRLLEDLDEPELKRMIKILDEGIELKGYKYKNHNLAIRKWKGNENHNSKSFYQKPLKDRSNGVTLTEGINEAPGSWNQ